MNNKNWLVVLIVVLVAFGVYSFYNGGASQSPGNGGGGSPGCPLDVLGECVKDCHTRYGGQMEILEDLQNRGPEVCCNVVKGETFSIGGGPASSCLSEDTTEFNGCVKRWEEKIQELMADAEAEKASCLAFCSVDCVEPQE